MPRAIPILRLYRELAQTDAQLVIQCANNYPFFLGGGIGTEGLFDFNRRVRETTAEYRRYFEMPNDDGLTVVEISDDFLSQTHFLANADAYIKRGDLARRVETEAEKAGIIPIAMGTGATFSYVHVKGENTAFFDRTASGQKLWLGYFDGWAKHARSIGLELYTGRRPGVLNKTNAFTNRILLGDISQFIRDVSVINLGEVRFGGLSRRTMISESEAMNLALALEMNRRVPGIMQSVEQMQYDGMEPTGVNQAVRFNRFLAANLEYGFFVDMADNGHVGVRGTRHTNNSSDYDLLAYARAYRGPILFIHHNILFENAKQPGTLANLRRDEQARLGRIKAKDMPFPERIRDINFYLTSCLANQNVRLAVVSPEPTCSLNTDQEQLALDVAEATCITALKIRAAGFEESRVLPFAFVTQGKAREVDKILERVLHA